MEWGVVTALSQPNKPNVGGFTTLHNLIAMNKNEKSDRS